MGDAGGFFYRVASATGGVAIPSAQWDFGTGLVESPVLDVTNGLVYVFSSSDGTAACAGGAACSAVYQLSTTFLPAATGSKVTVRTSVVKGTLPNPNPLYIGGFDSTYYNTAGGTGNLCVCGNTGGVPTLYRVPILAGAFQGIMISSASILGDVNALKCELAGKVLHSSGTLRLRVTGWSMLPSSGPGDMLVIEHFKERFATRAFVSATACSWFMIRVAPAPSHVGATAVAAERFSQPGTQIRGKRSSTISRRISCAS